MAVMPDQDHENDDDYGTDGSSPDGWRWAADEPERDDFWNSEK